MEGCRRGRLRLRLRLRKNGVSLREVVLAFWSQPAPAPSRTHERVHESTSIAGKCAVCRKVFVSFKPPSMDRDFIVHGWLAAR